MFSRIFSLFIISLLALGLSGCSPAGDDSFANGTSANSDANSDTQSDANADTDLNADGYAEIITASYELFMSQGITEEVFSAGDNYILTATSSEFFRAGCDTFCP